MKDTVNKIISEIAKDENIAELYSEWNKINREKLSLYFDKKKPDIPLEDNTEFRSLKNTVIKAAVEVLQNESMQNEPVLNAYSESVKSQIKLFAISLERMISKSYVKRISRLNGQIDRKLKSKIDEKKAAHGLKTDHSVSDYNDEDEGMSMTM